MKKFLLFCIVMTACAGDKKPAKNTVSEADLLRLQLVSAKLSALQLQATPLVQQRNDVYIRNCEAAKIELSNCQINEDTGEITARQAPAAQVPATPEKKK